MIRLKIYYSLLMIVIAGSMQAQDLSPYKDTSHYSHVFGHEKSYRIYLPQGYKTSGKKFPVIYFFHGWGGRHFKDDNALLDYKGIKLLVDRYQTILVMWDGNIDSTEPRPYNTGNHRDVRFNIQMKDYFPELTGHIDSTYRTLPDRQHRGIIGFSMGGFMSFFLAGKYPDKVSAAVSLAGSPEFFLGYPDIHSLYSLRYTMKNLSDVNIRLHNGDSDILYYLNDEVKEGAKWEGIKLDYWKFQGGHMIDRTGETKVFEQAMKFVMDAFKKRALPGSRWSHYDLYPSFNVWDYTIHTNKKEPGYLFLKNVDQKGFGFYAHQWLPEGAPFNLDSINITTAPLYKPSEKYQIVSYEKKSNKLEIRSQQADKNGRLHFFYQRPGIETGIYNDTSSASFILLDYHTGNKSRYLHNNQTGKIFLRLFNRGNTQLTASKIKLLLSSTDSSVIFPKKSIQKIIDPTQRIIDIPPFTVLCQKKPPLHAEPSSIKSRITIQNGSQIFSDDFIIPVLYESPLFDSIKVDDQQGNANGIAEAGENIILYSGSHRLRLYTEDTWVLSEEEKILDEVIPAIWPDGFTLSSMIKISPDCPDGHTIEFYGSYETKTFNPIERKTTWGQLKLTIQNNRLPKK